MKVFLLFFILIPLGELYVLIEVGSVIGALPTILLTVLTAFVGVVLMRSEGLATVQKMQFSLSQGEPPHLQMLEGMLIFIGGLFLLLPGLVTDFFGLLMLLPPVRAFMAKRFLESKRGQFRQKSQQGQNVYEAEWQEKSETTASIRHTKIIEGEVLPSDSDDQTKR